MISAAPIQIDWHPGLSIYASEPFLQAVGDEYGWLGGLDGNGKLRCILPYTIIRKGFIRMVRFRVETISVGEDFGIQEEKSFLASAMNHFRSFGADLVIPATTNTIFRVYPAGAIAAPYGTYIIDLAQPEGTIWGNISSSHRRKVRLAIKEKVEIRSGLEYLEPAYRLIQETFQRSSMPFMSYDSFRRMVLALGENVKLYAAEHKGEVQGCTVIPFSQHTAYYVYGGSVPNPINGANHLLHWEAIRQFREKGVARYDFVGVRINPEKGSKQDGLLTFKERFGGRLVQGYMWKYPIRRLKFNLYSLAVRILRGGDIVDIERHKLGSLAEG